MKATKIDFYTVSNKGVHNYEFSDFIQLNTKKPLTKIIIAKINELGLKNISHTHTRNNIYFNKVLNNDVFEQENVNRIYCIKN